jgi:extracellular factor (EF) 3-hydroxypalmitic acid methyl ester biosynthesis protein
MATAQVRLPQAFHEGLANLHDWLRCLASALPGEEPSAEDALSLTGHFQGLWEATGMDASLGLSRSTPDHRLFRSRVGQFLWESTLVRRCYEKPRGYAGDYLMMDAACNVPPLASSALGRWMNRWFYNEFPPSVAARHRRDLAAALLVAEHERGARRILNVACGGVPELARICRTTSFDEVVLLDQDADALDFAKASLKSRCHDIEAHSRITTLNLSVQALVRSPAAIGSGRFDVIYSMGLYDYLPDDRARKLAVALWDALAAGGMLAIGNFQGHDWWRYVLEAAMDWFLVYRDEDQMAELVAGLPGLQDVQVVTDASGSLFMLLARKK